MATPRPRIGNLGIRRQSMRAYNEPFTPDVEEIDENEAHILRLQLPGPKFHFSFYCFLIFKIIKLPLNLDIDIHYTLKN